MHILSGRKGAIRFFVFMGFLKQRELILLLWSSLVMHSLGGISCKKIDLHRAMNMFAAGL
jgi:hypothetical protein